MNKFNLSGFPSLADSMDAWIDFGRHKEGACELMISLIGDMGRRYVDKTFWLEFTAPSGVFLGWMRFEYQTNLRSQAIFAATEWRPANDPAPNRSDVLLPHLTPHPEAP